jgi:hypothetical protein
MNAYPFLISLLVVELFILFALFIAIVFHRFFQFSTSAIKKKRTAKLTDYFLHLVEKKGLFDLKTYPGKMGWHKITLQVLEAFNHRLEGGEWTTVLHSACEALLLKRARKWAKSIFWNKKNFAARAFALYSLPSDEPLILKLMDDKRFLIRSPASLAAIRLGSQMGVEKVLLAMSKEPGYAQFHYRDILLQESQKVFQQLVEGAAKEELHKAALDVLGAKSWGGMVPFLQMDLGSPRADIRALALRVLIRNPLPDSLSYFEKSVKDPDPKVRIMALQGLNLFPSEESWGILENGLSDPVWEVGVEAGKALKNRGVRGEQILKNQPSKLAAEVAHYALQFGG